MSSLTVHTLKTWPEPFRLIVTGAKRHEIRKADRPFKVGDLLRLQEWNPDTQSYTGAEVTKLVSHITTPGEWGLPETLCVLSLAPEPVHVWDRASVRAMLEAAGLGVQTVGRCTMTCGSIDLADIAEAINRALTGAEYGLPLAQEPKYTVSRRGRLMVRATGVEIPDDEPVFVLRGKDTLAASVLARYLVLVDRATENESHTKAVGLRAAAFEDFAADNPNRMRDPDTCVAGSDIASVKAALHGASVLCGAAAPIPEVPA